LELLKKHEEDKQKQNNDTTLDFLEGLGNEEAKQNQELN